MPYSQCVAWLHQRPNMTKLASILRKDRKTLSRWFEDPLSMRLSDFVDVCIVLGFDAGETLRELYRENIRLQEETPRAESPAKNRVKQR